MTHELDAKRLAAAREADAKCQREHCSESDCDGFLCHAAIRAYIGNAEPVGWQYRYRYSHDGDWSKWQAVRLEKADYVEEERRPIYSAPPPSPSVEELVRALEPFAKAAEDLDKNTPDQAHIWESPAAMSITAGDLRRAVLSSVRKEG